jgi:hypothetical protein
LQATLGPEVHASIIALAREKVLDLTEWDEFPMQRPFHAYIQRDSILGVPVPENLITQALFLLQVGCPASC